MHRDQLPATRCRHARVDGLQRPSGRTATSPQREPHHHHVADPGSQPESRTEISMGTRAHDDQPSTTSTRRVELPGFDG